jgi:HSP20 family protein
MTDKSTMRKRMVIALVFLLGVGTGAAGLMIQHSNLLGGEAHSAPPVYVPPQTVSPQPPPVSSSPSNQTPLGVQPDPFFGTDPFGSGSLDNWDPFQEMQRMHQRMERLFNDSFGRFQTSPQFSKQSSSLQFSPDADLRDEGDHYQVLMDLPGADKPEIEVKVEGQTLMVSGKRDEQVEEKDNNGVVIRSERRSGQFQRSIPLPGPVKNEAVEARYENGILTVTLPKASESAPSRKIEVK